MSNSVIYGGYSVDHLSNGNFDKLIKGNTLELHSKGLTAKNLANFEYIKFYLPDDIKKNDTILTLTDDKETNLSKTKIGVGVIDGSKPDLVQGDKVNLITVNSKLIYPTDMNNHIEVQKSLSKYILLN